MLMKLLKPCTTKSRCQGIRVRCDSTVEQWNSHNITAPAHTFTSTSSASPSPGIATAHISRRRYCTPPRFSPELVNGNATKGSVIVTSSTAAELVTAQRNGAPVLKA